MNRPQAFLLTAACLAAGFTLNAAETTKVLFANTFDAEKGGVLRIERVAPAGGSRELYQGLVALDKGTVTVAWNQTVESYQQGPNKPAVETLFTMRLRSGEMFFHVGFLGAAKGDGGAIVTSSSEIGRWLPGKNMKFKVVMNLDTNTCDVSIDGKVCARDIAVNRPAAMNGVLFKDGSGLGLQDGNFKVSLDDVSISYRVEGDKPLERYRGTPPVNNPAPTLNPKPADAKNWSVPGEVKTSWVGNSFSGVSGADGHHNGFGEWVQNGIAQGAFSVTLDGTVVAGQDWDEAGRCIGLYKDGKVNPRIVAQYDMRGGHSAWGFGSSNHAVATDGEWLYAGNNDGQLMRFRWTPGDLDSHHWVDQLELGKEWVALALAAQGGKVAGLFPAGDVRVWQADKGSFKALGQWKAPAGSRTMCYATDGGLWFVAGDKVMKTTAEGKPVPQATIADAGSPSAVAVAPDKTLLVCDNGPRQQVRLYDVTRTVPKFLKAFGDPGGLGSGTPGVPGPHKLYGLMGAGKDKDGNLYVGCCLHPASRGTAIKAFDPTGKPLWDLQCHGFTDGYSFDPASDGTEVVGADELISLDLSKPAGREWSLKALTLDPLKYPKDPRLAAGHPASGAQMRTLQGKRLLYTIGMQSGGYNLFVFEEGGQVAHAVGGTSGGGWAWSVDSMGDIWHGDAEKNTIRRYRFLKWDGGKPVFSNDKPDSWPMPPGLRQICRTHYDNASDTLYLGAFPDGVKEPSWGTAGSVIERYDGWVKGKQVKRWRADLPLDDNQLTPKAMTIAGDYAFAVAVKPSGGIPALISVFNLADGKLAGRIWPGKEVGGFCGWVDITHGINAHQRRDGEYLILLEDDFRGKNILYRWTPKP